MAMLDLAGLCRRRAPAPPGAPRRPACAWSAGQAAIVGGNAAGARERALDEAIRQAVDQSLAELLDAPTRAAQARAIKTLEARARTFVPRYRTSTKDEADGVYTIRLEVEVDERRSATRRSLDGAGRAARRRPPRFGGDDGGGEWSGRRGRGADAGAGVDGIRAQLGDPSLSDPTRAVQAAGRSALPLVAFVSATVVDEGIVRGAGQSAVSCRMARKVVVGALGASRSARPPRRRAPLPSARRRLAPTAWPARRPRWPPRLSPSGAARPAHPATCAV